MTDALRDTRRAESARCAELIVDNFVFMGSSSFYAVESARFAVRTVARELVGFSFAMTWANETERVSPRVGGSIFEISIAFELVEPARTTPAIVRAKCIDGVAHGDQRGSSLTHARAMPLSHAQDGDRAEHGDDDQNWANAAEHQ
jgi:hypothetical protein